MEGTPEHYWKLVAALFLGGILPFIAIDMTGRHVSEVAIAIGCTITPIAYAAVGIKARKRYPALDRFVNGSILGSIVVVMFAGFSVSLTIIFFSLIFDVF